MSLLQQGKKGSASLTSEHTLKLGTWSQQVPEIRLSTVSLTKGTSCHAVWCVEHRYKASNNDKLSFTKPRWNMVYIVMMLHLAFDVYAFTVKRAISTAQMSSSVDQVKIKYFLVHGGERVRRQERLQQR
jgi:hypothetical protein